MPEVGDKVIEEREGRGQMTVTLRATVGAVAFTLSDRGATVRM